MLVQVFLFLAGLVEAFQAEEVHLEVLEAASLEEEAQEDHGKNEGN